MNKKKAVFIAFQAAVAAVVLFVAGLLLASHFGYVNVVKPYIVQSGSMEPVIKVGSVVFAVPAKNYVPGNIISFAADGDKKRIITHRIALKKYPEGVGGAPTYLTSGDANEEFDRWEVKDEHIIGKVFLTVPYLGYLADFAKKPQGFILLVIIPATIIIYEEIRVLGKELKKIRKGVVVVTPSSRKELPKISIVVPAIGAAIVVISLSAAFFFDLETSLANILGAATSFGEKTAKLYNTDVGFTCPLGATDLSQGPFGTVIIKKVGGTIKVDTILLGATPSSTYDIWVNQDPATCPLSSPTAPGALTTDASGNGNAHVETPYVAPATNFWISAVGGGQVLRSTAVTLP